MPTNAEMFETMRNWHIWTGADYAARETDAEGRYASAEEHLAVRDQRTVDPIEVLSTTYDLIQSLSAGRGAAHTQPPRRGATWDQVAVALNVRADQVRNEFTAMVGWCSEHRPDFVDLARYRAAV